MAVNHYFYVMSNDGSTTLFTSANTVSNDTTITVTETGLTIGTETYTYSGDKKFIGVSGTSGTTAPDLAIGDSFTGAYETVYIVESEAEEPTTSGVTVEYDGSVVATIPSGNKATIPIADKKMKTDIVITVPEAEGGTDSPLPIEVSTEAEMTALLESGEVGGVYKYTGTTGTYENGALYVLEEEAVSTKTLTVTNNDSYSPYVDYWIDKSNTETADGNTFLNIGGEVTEFTGISSYIILGCETAFDSISDAVGCTYESISSSVLKITLTADTASIIVEVND